jgi:hypothetical protein
MRRVHWLHAVAALWLVGGAITGSLLVAVRGLVVAGGGDCIHPVGPCFTQGNPHALAGFIVWLVAGVAGVVTWRIASNLGAGRSPAGYLRREPERP